ncbi:MAG: hypothetical protein PHD06_12455 [Bacteroidales bacterium]|jgi:hypothetical protein|nr:hypothetical protein [Bacteroidales bacterium]MDD4385977.1 hypothetical protein [Bacteroidales bacterium]MDY0198876.1 hypothetical protein [Tenuifilaceae bacterium]
MKELTLEQMETTQGGKFWGWDCVPTGEMYIMPNGECQEIWNCTRFMFWIEVDEEPVTGGCATW